MNRARATTCTTSYTMYNQNMTKKSCCSNYSSCISLFAIANCNIASLRARNSHINNEKYCISSQINCPVLQVPRGGATAAIATQINLSSSMASLFAGCVGGAVGVGVSYPFDTLSTKAQVRLQGKDQLNLAKSIKVIWKNEGIRGFFEGVIGTVRFNHHIGRLYFVYIFLTCTKIRC